MIDTKTATDRRVLRFESYDEVLADAHTLTQCETRTVGNWNLGQILMHLGLGFETAIDGSGFALPLPMRWLMTLTMKHKVLYKQLPSGFPISPKAAFLIPPPETTPQEGLARMRSAVQRLSREDARAFHPAFGRISRAEWDAFNLRHAEMHLGFVHPRAAK